MACVFRVVQAGNSRELLRIIQAPRTPATAVSAAATETSAAVTASQSPFENVQRFYVPDEAKPHFEAAWKAREAYMETQPGFVSFNMATTDDKYTITSKWASIPEWEAFNLSKGARRHHLPSVCPQFRLPIQDPATSKQPAHTLDCRSVRLSAPVVLHVFYVH